jgi:hypothetical protein
MSPEEEKGYVLNSGDVVHFGPETTQKGKKVHRYGKVINVTGKNANVYSYDKDKIISIPKNQLVEIPSQAFPPEDLATLDQLTGLNKTSEGGFRSWMKFTSRQRKKFKIPEKATSMPLTLNDLMVMFSGVVGKKPQAKPLPEPESPEPEPEIPQSINALLGQPEEPKPGPLAQRLAAVRGKSEIPDLSALLGFKKP